jgi:hypothetical protein
MKIYTESNRFCPHTGKPMSPTVAVDTGKFICDYSGELYDMDQDDGQMRAYLLCIEYNDDSEPVWYEEYHKFKEEFGIDYGDFSKFMDSSFHFANTKSYGAADLSEKLVQEWVKARKTKKGRFSQCATIEQVLTELRFGTLRKLLLEKKFTLEQLGLTTRKKFNVTEAEKMYREGYGCSCQYHPPCSFCMALTEEEANIIWNEGMTGLQKYWATKKTLQEDPPVV